MRGDCASRTGRWPGLAGDQTSILLPLQHPLQQPLKPPVPILSMLCCLWHVVYVAAPIRKGRRLLGALPALRTASVTVSWPWTGREDPSGHGGAQNRLSRGGGGAKAPAIIARTLGRQRTKDTDTDEKLGLFSVNVAFVGQSLSAVPWSLGYLRALTRRIIAVPANFWLMRPGRPSKAWDISQENCSPATNLVRRTCR
ncbi:hypothetical protein B0J13DRAFT_216667 [Dactylonectria estremocensis]|uniref:Uncharacterized protein n=1 Tax=Dactylonectria estremocensis TaxID=1079267 RepID=A0A9P9F6C9_9HYPO|nr:hypothetical protein B0J13DRAFT_216667 [Dactylonectria estremocensis]